ncbi:MAG: type II secretion system F family protein, partial [Phycisphaerae bacterium]
MAVFAYRASAARQEALTGTITADTPALARQALRSRGLVIERIQPVVPAAGSLWQRLGVGARFGSRRTSEQVAELWRNLAVLLEAGVPLAEALNVSIRQQAGRIQTVLHQLHETVCNGQAFAEALRQHPRWFDALTLSIVEVGQRSGALPGALGELAEYQGRQRALANRLTTALIYPVFLCLVGTAVVIFLMSHVVPQLVEVLTSAGRELPAPTRLLKTVSDGLVGHGPLLAGALAGLLLGGGVLFRTGGGGRLFERIALGTPVLGDLVRKAWVARISLMLTTLLRADVRFTEALRTVRQGLPHRLFADELEKVQTAVEAGADIAEPLKDSRL